MNAMEWPPPPQHVQWATVGSFIRYTDIGTRAYMVWCPEFLEPSDVTSERCLGTWVFATLEMARLNATCHRHVSVGEVPTTILTVFNNRGAST